MFLPRKFLAFSIVFLFTGFLLSIFILKNKSTPSKIPGALQTVHIAGTNISVEIVNTEADKENGLSGRENLSENNGMLFNYKDNPQFLTFWMKDMKIPIDIIWIKNNKVVQIDENIPIPLPGTSDFNLKHYPSKFVVDYVLEVNAGFSKKHNFKVGDNVEIK